MTLILGIDEAGRGPVVGPMVIAGALADESILPELKKLGVKDSKELTYEKREELYQKIIKILKDYVIIKISAKDIDNQRKIKNLNKIEAENMAKIIKSMKPDKVYVDAPQVSTDKFKGYLIEMSKTSAKIIAENYADKKYVICSAASILAKVERDREIRKIEKEYGIKLNTGYPHDEITLKTLKDWYKKHGEFPEFVRKSWFTAKEIASQSKQKSLKDY